MERGSLGSRPPGSRSRTRSRSPRKPTFRARSMRSSAVGPLVLRASLHRDTSQDLERFDSKTTTTESSVWMSPVTPCSSAGTRQSEPASPLRRDHVCITSALFTPGCRDTSRSCKTRARPAPVSMRPRLNRGRIIASLGARNSRRRRPRSRLPPRRPHHRRRGRRHTRHRRRRPHPHRRPGPRRSPRCRLRCRHRRCRNSQGWC